ncbi:hypothetical protein Tsubulata_043846 [Turnera subulata]|uniref:DUF4283 domain-containing protein n=1 Tax=Turnera subulata TaxID=218843 RepID=A0A9Q0F4T2_9ROSI|nr:hypothetical protein Tsubulata_043846 [Turnera subulata]
MNVPRRTRRIIKRQADGTPVALPHRRSDAVHNRFAALEHEQGSTPSENPPPPHHTNHAASHFATLVDQATRKPKSQQPKQPQPNPIKNTKNTVITSNPATLCSSILTSTTETIRSIEEERCTKKVRLKVGEDGVPIQSQPRDVAMEEPRMSYKDKLSKGKAILEDEDPWLLEEEPECEDGDIIITEDENGPKVELSAAFKKRLEKPWEKAVIVKLLGREIGYRALHTKIQSMWKPSGPFRLIDMENNFFIVRFWDSIDYWQALTGGPWAIYDHALCVQPWCQNFRAKAGAVEKATVWVRFPDLPVDRYHSKVLKTMGNMVGSTVRIDVKTESQTRAKFTKVAVAVDLMKPLKGMVRLDNEEYMVSYEGLPQICFSCGRYGHSSLLCSHQCPSPEGTTVGGDLERVAAPSSTPSVPTVPGGQPQQAPVRKNKQEVGEWMVAQRRSRRPNQRQAESTILRNQGGGTRQTGNRFQMLESEPITLVQQPASLGVEVPSPPNQHQTPKAQKSHTYTVKAKPLTTNRKAQPNKLSGSQAKPYTRRTPLKDVSNCQTQTTTNSFPDHLTASPSTSPTFQPKVILKSTPSATPTPRPAHSAIALEASFHRIIYPKTSTGQEVENFSMIPPPSTPSTSSHTLTPKSNTRGSSIPMKPPDPTNGPAETNTIPLIGAEASNGFDTHMEEDPSLTRREEGSSV